MATGYGLGGNCYSTATSALHGFQQSFPRIDSMGTTVVQSSAVGGGPIPLLSYQLGVHTFFDDATVTRSGTIALSRCDFVTDSMLDVTPSLVASMLVAFFGAFFLRKTIRKFAIFAGGFSHDF